MPHNSKNAIVITSMMTGYCKEGILDNARVLFEGIQADDATLVSVFTACSSLKSLKKGRQARVLVIRNGFIKNVSVCNALVTMYSKCGGIY
ncbi:hypothetical protein QYF36_009145 [Acer negundo]|nr:hypothetical protein QYF36_009145 [Acer negundo]